MATTTRIRETRLEALTCDDAVQSRVFRCETTVAEYADAMRADAEFPPVVAFDDGDALWLADGFHRVAAARWLGFPSVPVEIRKGSRRDAMLYAIEANQRHGLRRTNADKRKAVATLLADAEWRQWSDREIARRCGVSDRFVNDQRASANGSQIEATTRLVERGGVTYPMHTAAIGRSRVEPTDGALALDGSVEQDGSPDSRLAVHFSSETPEHYTPAAFLVEVESVFGDIPDLDPCSNSGDAPNVSARHHFTIAENGLTQRWHGRVFVNPPYGRELPAWIAKLRAEWADDHIQEAIALLPARTDTEWFDALTRDSDDAVICFLSGRLTFVGNDDPAPFPSMAVYFGANHGRFACVFGMLGSLWLRPARPSEWFEDRE